MHDAAELLAQKARTYELKAAWHAEHHGTPGQEDPGHRDTALTFATVAIVLHEVAHALEDAA